MIGCLTTLSHNLNAKKLNKCTRYSYSSGRWGQDHKCIVCSATPQIPTLKGCSFQDQGIFNLVPRIPHPIVK